MPTSKCAPVNCTSQKKMGDILRVGTGGSLCFCGLNLYFKNEKFYNDFVTPVLNKLDPETANKMTQKAAQYDLLPKSKLKDNNVMINDQPSSKSDELWQEDLINVHYDNSDNMFAFDDGEFSDSASLNDFKALPRKCKNNRLCDSPTCELSSTAPDSPSLSTRVNIDSPLRRSKISLTEQDEKPPIDELIHIIIPDQEQSLSVESENNIPALTIATKQTECSLCDSKDCSCQKNATEENASNHCSNVTAEPHIICNHLNENIQKFEEISEKNEKLAEDPVEESSPLLTIPKHDSDLDDIPIKGDSV